MYYCEGCFGCKHFSQHIPGSSPDDYCTKYKEYIMEFEFQECEEYKTESEDNMNKKGCKI